MFSLCPRENKDAGGQALAKATGHHEHDLKQQRQANVFPQVPFSATWDGVNVCAEGQNVWKKLCFKNYLSMCGAWNHTSVPTYMIKNTLPPFWFDWRITERSNIRTELKNNKARWFESNHDDFVHMNCRSQTAGTHFSFFVFRFTTCRSPGHTPCSFSATAALRVY